MTARGQFDNPASGYSGTVHFTSTDAQATFPGDYTFTAGDNGAHVFASAVTLRTAGSQTITATDTANGSITGTTNSVSVSAAPASQLDFLQQPTSGAATSSISPALTVRVRDIFGNLVNGASVTIAIDSNPAAGTLSGTTASSSINGIASFSDLSINRAGSGYTLTASSAGATTASSSSVSSRPRIGQA